MELTDDLKIYLFSLITETMLTKLNSTQYLQIADLTKGAFQICVYNDTLMYTSPKSLHFPTIKTGLEIIYTTQVKKTPELSRCYKLYKLNDEIGVDLFIKALEKEGINLYKEIEESLKEKV